MLVEYNNFKNAFNCMSKSSKLKNEYQIIYGGVGEVESASEVAIHLFSNEKYDLVVDVGYAAAFGNIDIGSLVIPKSCRYSDVHIPESTNDELSDLTKSYDLDGSYECQIFTSNSFVDKSKVDLIKKRFNVDCGLCDMEATAIAQICYDYSQPFSVMKLVSDKPDSDKQEENNFGEFVKQNSDFTIFMSALEMIQ